MYDISDPDKKINAALLALPYAIGTHRLKKTADRRAPTQISKKESADHFVTFVQTDSEGTELHSQRVQAFEGTVQPYVIAVGKLGSVSHCFVKYLDLSLKTDTIVQAVDLCFKLIFVFNCEYTPQCRHVWQALELVCYGLKESTKFLHSALTLASTCAQFIESVVKPPAETGAPSDEQLVLVKIDNHEIVGDECICYTESGATGEVISFVNLNSTSIVSGQDLETLQHSNYGTCTSAFANEHELQYYMLHDNPISVDNVNIVTPLPVSRTPPLVGVHSLHLPSTSGEVSFCNPATEGAQPVTAETLTTLEQSPVLSDTYVVPELISPLPPRTPVKDVGFYKETRTPSKKTPSKKTPSKKTPCKETPSKKTPSKESPSKKTPSKQCPSKECPSKESPTKETRSKKTPSTVAAQADYTSSPASVISLLPRQPHYFISSPSPSSCSPPGSTPKTAQELVELQKAALESRNSSRKHVNFPPR